MCPAKLNFELKVCVNAYNLPPPCHKCVNYLYDKFSYIQTVSNHNTEFYFVKNSDKHIEKYVFLQNTETPTTEII